MYEVFNARPFLETPRSYFSEQFCQLFTTFTNFVLGTGINSNHLLSRLYEILSFPPILQRTILSSACSSSKGNRIVRVLPPLTLLKTSALCTQRVLSFPADALHSAWTSLPLSPPLRDVNRNAESVVKLKPHVDGPLHVLKKVNEEGEDDSVNDTNDINLTVKHLVLFIVRGLQSAATGYRLVSVCVWYGTSGTLDATGTILLGTGTVNNSENRGNGEGDSENVGMKVNFRTLFTPRGNGIDVVVPLESIGAVSERFSNTAYGFFLGKCVPYPIVANYVRNTWGKYGLVRSMFSSSTGLFSFQFSSMNGLDAMLENGPCFIRNNPLILKKWHPDMNLLKEEVGTVPVWVKLHGVPVTTFSEDRLSAIATKLDCGCKITREGYYTCNICVEYEWKPPRCACCKVFGHVLEECPKNIGAGATKNLKKTSQTPKGIPVGQKMGFEPTKQVFQHVSKKPTANTSGKKKNNAEPTKEVSESNPFEVITSVENDMELGTNGGTSKLASQEANSSGSSFLNVDSGSPSTTPIIEKIDKIEKLIIDERITLVDDEGKPLEKVVYSGYYDSEDEVASVDNEMASFLAKKDGYGAQSLLEQWKESYENVDYEYDPYDDDMYEGQDIPEKLQAICDNLDRGCRKK
ncbi:putative reverse transcriptase domain-containing protein [Tanacetum coccineum]